MLMLPRAGLYNLIGNKTTSTVRRVLITYTFFTMHLVPFTLQKPACKNKTSNISNIHR